LRLESHNQIKDGAVVRLASLMHPIHIIILFYLLIDQRMITNYYFTINLKYLKFEYFLFIFISIKDYLENLRYFLDLEIVTFIIKKKLI
jgi:hypothetical protein